jgi:5'-nucleotidase
VGSRALGLTANWSSVEIVQTRYTGGAETDAAVAGTAPGTFTWGNVDPKSAGVNTCLNEDCSLLGETDTVNAGKVSVSLFTIDCSAPKNCNTTAIMQRLNTLTSQSG